MAVAVRAFRAGPLTAAIALLTTATFAAQLAEPAVVDLLHRDAALIRDGQWWRLLSPLLVQPSGWGQYLYNTLGLLLVGVAVERRLGQVRWLLLFLAGGLAGVAFALLLDPSGTGGGSSDAVAALIGALAVLTWRDSSPPAMASRLYGFHFTVYLAVLAAAGPTAGTIAGALAVAVFMATRAGRVGRWGLAAAVVTGALVMVGLGDPHGVGLLTGLVLAMALARTAAKPTTPRPRSGDELEPGVGAPTGAPAGAAPPPQTP
ncbi:rhomboid family intramembrane serine protease [Catellatospora sp. KI3]|uniref:rhomboid family intramembrane serine protease n=1 Tax=Catellatospora sp. KI3 TaxID=3041620 RepID=UPI002482635C|nr:rhomboid family intramembrane serine protease [Catellatospora sp. KI3]MDI1460929.1 rhomboid family intramembrane serine protease [Catellatospora sp. KI3]